MKKKIIGILIVTLLITPIAIGSIEEQKEETYNSKIENFGIYWIWEIDIWPKDTPGGFYLNIGEADDARDGPPADAHDYPHSLTNQLNWYCIDGFGPLGDDYRYYPDTEKRWHLYLADGTYPRDVTIKIDWSGLGLQVYFDFEYTKCIFYVHVGNQHINMFQETDYTYNHKNGDIDHFEIRLYVNEAPNYPVNPTGPTSLFVGEEGEYSAQTTDPEGDMIKYWFMFDGPSVGDYLSTSFMPSGTRGSVTYLFTGPGTHWVFAWAEDEWGNICPMSDPLTITVTENNPPNTPTKPTGQSTRTIHQSGTYSTSATDPENHLVKYRFDWDDGHISKWTNYLNSGDTGYMDHSWSNPGTYQVKAQAKDEYDLESSWSTTYTITVTEEQVGEPPETPEILDAPTTLAYGETYAFTAVTTDPDDDDVQYEFTWDYEGDWTFIATDFMESGMPCTVEQSFESPGHTMHMAMDVGARDTNGLMSDFCEAIGMTISDPPTEVYITGPTSGTAGEEYVYHIRGYDPNNNDLVDFAIDWGDGDDVFISDIPIMSEVNVSHIWSSEGDYQISVTIYDFNSLRGPTETLSVSMPKVKTHRWFHPWLSDLFERFPFLEPLLQQILGLR